MDEVKIKSYRDLWVWQRAVQFAVEVYRVPQDFPRHELYGELTDQIRRSAVSIPSNIAEGHIKRSDKVFTHHLDIALGSAAELDTQLKIALEVGYLEGNVYTALVAELQEITRTLFSLLATVTGKR